MFERARRQLLVGLVVVLAALTLVWSTTAEPAAADLAGAQQIIPAAAGSAAATGGAVAVCTASVVCVVGVGAVATGVALYGGYQLLQWAFDDPEVATTVTPGTTTSAGGGYWSSLFGQSPVQGVESFDGYELYPDNRGGVFRMVVNQAVATGSTAGDVKVTLSWSGWSSGMPSQSNNVKVQLDCIAGGYYGEEFDITEVAPSSAGLLSGSVQFTLPSSGCADYRNGVEAVRIYAWPATGSTWSNGGGYAGRYVMPTGTPNYGGTVPSHTWDVSKVCANGAGGTTTVTSGSGSWVQTDPDPIPNPVCPSDYPLPTSFTALETTAGQSSVSRLTWTAPTSWTNPGSVAYSDCLPGGSAAPCQLRLLKVTPTGQIDCATGSVDCTDFDPSTSTENQYRCRWATHAVPLAQCAGLQTLLPSPSGPTTTLPEGEVKTGPPPPNGPIPDELDDPENECWPEGWGMLNPASWVLRPTMCALKWAFIPEDPGQHADAISDAADGSMVTTPIAIVDDLYSSVTGLINAANTTDCSGPEVQLNVPGSSVEVSPLDACSGTMATIASTTKTILSIGIVIAGGVALVNMLMAIWGGPQINNDSSGGDGEKDGQGRFVL